jgi:hypothetical protein
MANISLVKILPETFLLALAFMQGGTSPSLENQMKLKIFWCSYNLLCNLSSFLENISQLIKNQA